MYGIVRYDCSIACSSQMMICDVHYPSPHLCLLCEGASLCQLVVHNATVVRVQCCIHHLVKGMIKIGGDEDIGYGYIKSVDIY